MRDDTYPVLPIGKVNLATASNSMFGTMWECWEENAQDVDILLIDTEKMSYRVAHSSGTSESWLNQLPVRSVIRLQHDQTRARIGGDWMVIGIYPHTKDGLLSIQKECGKKSLSFACFK